MKGEVHHQSAIKVLQLEENLIGAEVIRRGGGRAGGRERGRGMKGSDSGGRDYLSNAEDMRPDLDALLGVLLTQYPMDKEETELVRIGHGLIDIGCLALRPSSMIELGHLSRTTIHYLFIFRTKRKQ